MFHLQELLNVQDGVLRMPGWTKTKITNKNKKFSYFIHLHIKLGKNKSLRAMSLRAKTGENNVTINDRTALQTPTSTFTN